MLALREQNAAPELFQSLLLEDAGDD